MQKTWTLKTYRYKWPAEKKCPHIMDKMAKTFIQSSQTILSDIFVFDSICIYLFCYLRSDTIAEAIHESNISYPFLFKCS